MKKTYRKPELKTRKVEFGVFGDYGNGGGSIDPSPVDRVGHFQIHME